MIVYKEKKRYNYKDNSLWRFLNNLKHCDDKPSYIRWDKRDQIGQRNIDYYKRNKSHRCNKPATKRYACQLSESRYKTYNIFYRINGPALIEWYLDGQPYNIIYCQSLEVVDNCIILDYHRHYGPGEIGWHENGQTFSVSYYKGDLEHRDNGPSYQEWDEEGQIKIIQYLTNGV